MPKEDIVDKVVSATSKPVFAIRKAVYGLTPNGYTDQERADMAMPEYRKGNLPKGDPRTQKPIAKAINNDTYDPQEQKDFKYPTGKSNTREARIKTQGNIAEYRMQQDVAKKKASSTVAKLQKDMGKGMAKARAASAKPAPSMRNLMGMPKAK
jgi:hypothetical protein